MAYEKNIEKLVVSGKNSLSAEPIFRQKKLYYDKVYPDGELPWVDRPIDFINDNPLYGKVNLEKDFIYPKTDVGTAALEGGLISSVGTMKQLNSAGSSGIDLKTFNFVAEAFEDLKSYITAQANNGFIKSSGIIGQCMPKKSFVDFQPLARQFKELHWGHFSLVYLLLPSADDTLRNFSLKDEIDDFSKFVKYYIEFLKTASPEFPITRSGILNTTYASPLSTGLCIEIHDAAYDDDSAKQQFIEDSNFNFFKCAARMHGFILDRNVPWRLVADVTSYKMREYMRIAFERPQIEARQSEVLQARKEALEEITPGIITVDDIIDGDIPNPLGKWPPEKVSNFQKETLEQIEAVRAEIATDNAGVWETVNMKGAADPKMHLVEIEVTIDETDQVEKKMVLVPDCDGTICPTRIMKLDFFFQRYYSKAHLEDAWDLRRMVWQFWKSWINKNPYTKKIRTVGCVENGFKTKVVEHKEVQDIKWRKYKSQYGDLFWLKFYFDIRIFENKIKFKPAEYKKKMKKINFLRKSFDFHQAVEYINGVTKHKMPEIQDIYVSRPEPEEMILDWS